MVSAWFGGLGPGLLATLLSTIAGFYLFLMPFDARFVQEKVDWVQTGLSVLIGISISVLSGLLHSARQNAEQGALALKESEGRLKLALKAGNAATLDWDIATGEVSWSDEHYRLFGFEPGAIVPSFGSWLGCMHPDDRDRSITSARRPRDSSCAPTGSTAELRLCLLRVDFACGFPVSFNTILCRSGR